MISMECFRDNEVIKEGEIKMTTEKISLGRVRGLGIFAWDSSDNLEDITKADGAKIGDSIMNTGLTTVAILGVATEVGGIVKSTSATVGVATGNIGGFNVFTWSDNQDLKTLADIDGAKIGDSIINTGTSTINILGKKVEVGGIVKISWNEHYIGIPVENCDDFSVHIWNESQALDNIAKIPRAKVGDYIINTGSTQITILGQNTKVGGIVKIISLTDGELAENINNFNILTWNKSQDLEKITEIPKAKINDYIVNIGAGTVKILGQSTKTGEIIQITTATTGESVKNINGSSVFTWNESEDVTAISNLGEAKIGDFIINTGTKSRNILGTMTEVGKIVQVDLNEDYESEPIGNIRGFGVHSWKESRNLTNISEINGARINDLIINASTTTRTVLNVNTEVGGIVRIKSAITGETAGNISGFNVFPWNSTTAITNILQIDGAKLGDSIVNTAMMATTILGINTQIGGIVKITSATTGVDAGNIRGFSVHTWNSDITLSNTSQIPEAQINDTIINTGSTTVTLLGVSTQTGGMVKIISPTIGASVGNIRGFSLHTWSLGNPLSNISQIPESRINDLIINTGVMPVVILGVNTPVGGMVQITSAINGVGAGNIRGPQGEVMVVDNLNSHSNTDPLSANQGRVLDTKVATKQTKLIAGDNIVLTDNSDGTQTISALDRMPLPPEHAIMGVEWNFGNPSPSLVRLDGAVGLVATSGIGTVSGFSDFDRMPIYKNIQRCNVNANGIVTAYEGQPGFSFTASDVMVEIPLFYYRVEQDNARQIRREWISNKQTDGFAPHPAFARPFGTVPFIYVGAYETGAGHVSRSGLFPLSSQTRAQFRTGARNKGAFWSLTDFASRMALEMLIKIEFASLNSQSVIAPGNTGNTAANPVMVRATGMTNNLIGTGREAGAADKVSFVWRGIENVWGNIWEFIDGLNNNSGQLWFNLNPATYADSTQINYTALGITMPTNGNWTFATRLSFDTNNPWVAIPNANINGSATTFLCDTHWPSASTGWHIALAGGCYWSFGGKAGLYTWNVMNSAPALGTHLGARLLCIPR